MNENQWDKNREAYEAGYKAPAGSPVPQAYADSRALRDNWLDGQADALQDAAWARANENSLATSGREVPY
jgi:hypothetical protein